MNVPKTSRESLSFTNGNEVLLSHLNGGRRVWANGVEAFWQANLRSDHVEFRRLSDDGIDLADVAAVRGEDQKPVYFKALGDVAYLGAVLLEDTDDWQCNTVGVPYPETIDLFRQKHLVPIGANSFPLKVIEGDGDDKEFTLQTIMEALVAKQLPIASNAGYFHHDMNDHSVGMAAIDRNCMKSLRALALFSQQLADRNPFASYDLAYSIAKGLDYHSYYEFFATNMAVASIDPLLTGIMASAVTYDKKHRQHMQTALKNNGFDVRGYTVMRSHDTRRYYANALEILNPASLED